ncbi:unnamed protein product [Symbiodinium sp. CCMP2592]|nr:unnamed protein product [Symbiodinium sp. CCMP2592]
MGVRGLKTADQPRKEGNFGAGYPAPSSWWSSCRTIQLLLSDRLFRLLPHLDQSEVVAQLRRPFVVVQLQELGQLQVVHRLLSDRLRGLLPHLDHLSEVVTQLRGPFVVVVQLQEQLGRLQLVHRLLSDRLWGLPHRDHLSEVVAQLREQLVNLDYLPASGSLSFRSYRRSGEEVSALKSSSSQGKVDTVLEKAFKLRVEQLEGEKKKLAEQLEAQMVAKTEELEELRKKMQEQASEEMKLKETELQSAQHKLESAASRLRRAKEKHDKFRSTVRAAVAKWHCKTNFLERKANNAKQRAANAEELLKRAQLESELKKDLGLAGLEANLKEFGVTSAVFQKACAQFYGLSRILSLLDGAFCNDYDSSAATRNRAWQFAGGYSGYGERRASARGGSHGAAHAYIAADSYVAVLAWGT